MLNYSTGKVKSAYEPIVAHQAGAYPSFYSSMKQPGVFLLSLDGMLVHLRVTPQH